MTEETIINGVDVSGCKFKSRFDNECYSDVDSTENLNCKDNPNCYYRQLKRLELENAKLLKGKKMRLEHLDKLFDFFNITLGDALLFAEKDYIDRQDLIKAILEELL